VVSDYKAADLSPQCMSDAIKCRTLILFKRERKKKGKTNERQKKYSKALAGSTSEKSVFVDCCCEKKNL
jgi:hypothetical protein